MNKIKTMLTWVLLLAATQVMGITVSVEPIEIEAGKSSELIINLTNTETTLTGYQMSLYLPEGVTLQTDGEGDYFYTLSSRHKKDHQLTIRQDADGSLLLVCFSASKKVISGTSGELLRLPIDVAPSVSYSLQGSLRNMKFGDTASQGYYPADVYFTLTLPQGTVEPDDPNPVVTGNVTVSVADIEIKAGGEAEIVVDMTSDVETLTGYQMSLYLPDGVTLQTDEEGDYAYTLSSRHKKDHQLTIRLDADGSLLLVCFSASKKVISGTSGELLRLPINIASTVSSSLQGSMKNMKFGNTASQGYYPADVNFTMTLDDSAPVVTGPVSVNVPDVTIKAGGKAEIVVNLTNEVTTLTGYQMSLYLPEGITLQTDEEGDYDYTLSSRHKKDHTLTIKQDVDGSLLLVCFSATKKVLGGTSGELLRLPINVSSSVTTSLQGSLRNMKFGDTDSQGYYPDDVTFILLLSTHSLKGDVNGDGAVDVADIASIISVMAGSTNGSSASADVNGDGAVDVADIATVISIMAANARNRQAVEE